MKKGDLDKIVEKHGLWALGADGGARADLRRAYLGGADLRLAYLRGADLHGADLRGTFLSWADLDGLG